MFQENLHYALYLVFFQQYYNEIQTHRRYIDRRRNKALNKIIKYLQSKNIDYGITELHLAFDIEVDTAIDNFLPIKLTKGMNINDPYNYTGTKSKGRTSLYPNKSFCLSLLYSMLLSLPK